MDLKDKIIQVLEEESRRSDGGYISPCFLDEVLDLLWSHYDYRNEDLLLWVDSL